LLLPRHVSRVDAQREKINSDNSLREVPRETFPNKKKGVPRIRTIAETPFLKRAKQPRTTKGKARRSVMKYGKMRLKGCEKLYTLIIVNFVVVAVVFQLPYAVIIETVMLNRYSFMRSCVTVKEGCGF
jgi:hypothetical protein